MKTIALALALLAGCLTDPTDPTDESVELDTAELTEVDDADVEAIDLAQDVPCDEPALGDATPFYGSGYSSNCYCTFCQKYCNTNGQTYKSGSCC